MSITQDDLQDFHRFAGEQLKRGPADSLVALAGEWEAQRREVREIDIPINVAINSEEWRKLAAAFPDVQDEAKLKQALARRGGVTTAQMLANAASAADASIEK